MSRELLKEAADALRPFIVTDGGVENYFEQMVADEWVAGSRVVSNVLGGMMNSQDKARATLAKIEAALKDEGNG